jgi:hypothetical protein
MTFKYFKISVLDVFSAAAACEGVRGGKCGGRDMAVSGCSLCCVRMLSIPQSRSETSQCSPAAVPISGVAGGRLLHCRCRPRARGCKSLNATSQWLWSVTENCRARSTDSKRSTGCTGVSQQPRCKLYSPHIRTALVGFALRWKGSHRSEVHTSPRQAPCSQHPRCGRVSVRTLLDRNIYMYQCRPS